MRKPDAANSSSSNITVMMMIIEVRSCCCKGEDKKKVLEQFVASADRRSADPLLSYFDYFMHQRIEERKKKEWSNCLIKL